MTKEERTEKIKEWLKMLTEALEEAAELGQDMQMFTHAGQREATSALDTWRRFEPDGSRTFVVKIGPLDQAP